MKQADPIQKTKDEAIARWLKAVYSLYPLESSGFLRTNQEEFANPVGHTTTKAAQALLSAVLGENIAEETVQEALHNLLRVRSVQALSPAAATGILFLMKPILRELYLVDLLAQSNLHAYLDMESRIDSLSLMAFDLYTANKEQIFAERLKERDRSQVQLMRLVDKLNIKANN